MRGRLMVMVFVGLAAVVATAIVVSAGGDDPPRPARPAATAAARAPMDLQDRTVTAGEIVVGFHPRRFDEEGAVFHVTLDTHSVELDMDIASEAVLQVGGVSWGPATWTGGDGGGHHRSGELRFDALGEPSGDVELCLCGLAASTTWRS